MRLSRLATRELRMQRNPEPVHRFSVGELVQMSGLRGQAQTYRITGVLPERGDSLQYRIRHDEERHERVVTQDLLEPAAPKGNLGLIERTFSNG